MNGGGADHKIRLTEIVRRVTDGDGNAQRTQMLHGGGVAHIAALHLKSHGVQDLGKRTHGNAADAREVRPPTGDEIGVDVHNCCSSENHASDTLGGLPKRSVM